MVSPSVKRAASLAVSKYGADRRRVWDALQSQSDGAFIDFLETLVGQNLLTVSQANELRQALDTTHLDPGSVATRQKAAANNHRPPTPPGETPELRSLGEFRIVRLLGEGGMGQVYLGYQEDKKRLCAIKVLSDDLIGSQIAVDRFYREAKSGAMLGHPNIVGTHAAGQDQATGKHYLVLEYVDGPSARRCSRRTASSRSGTRSISPWTSPVGWSTPTRGTSFTATSSRPTSCSPDPGSPNSRISGWPSGPTRPAT